MVLSVIDEGNSPVAAIRGHSLDDIVRQIAIVNDQNLIR
jgi:hypothetical protein